MLTANQRTMLEKRKDRDIELGQKEQKYIDYTLRNYIKKQLDSLKDLFEVMEVLPEDQVKSVLTPQHAINLFDVLEKFLDISPPNEVEDETDELLIRCRVNFGKALPGVDNDITSVEVKLPASEEERQYWIKTRNFMNSKLRDVLENIKAYPPSYTSKDFNRKILPSLNKIANQRGAFCDVQVVSVIGNPTTRWKKSDPLSAAQKRIESHIPKSD